MKKLFAYCWKILSCFLLVVAVENVCSVEAQPLLYFNPVIQNLHRPVKITNAGDGSDRLFIVEQTGQIKIYKKGKLIKKPFLDIRDKVGSGLLKGLLSIAFPPNYITSRSFFVFYTDKNDATLIARYKTSSTNADSAISNSEKTLISLSPFLRLGDLNFGKDGYLYVSISDGSFGNKIVKLAQDSLSLHGKMLRLNVNVPGPPYYSIPPDNPFAKDPNVLPEIWAFGLRNAWRWSFDRSNGNLWICDVGSSRMEGIDLKKPQQPAGVNFGWPCYEASLVMDATGCAVKKNYKFPIFTYAHENDTSAEVFIGGYVYRGNRYPSLQGYYICADYTKGNAWKIISNGLGGWSSFLQTGIPTSIESFGEDEHGELYATSHAGIVYHVEVAGSIGLLNSSTIGSAENNKSASRIYPTIINNHSVVLDLKEVYDRVRIIDISGREVMQKPLNAQTGKIILNLLPLSAGVYTIQLLGTHTLFQKVFVTE